MNDVERRAWMLRPVDVFVAERLEAAAADDERGPSAAA